MSLKTISVRDNPCLDDPQQIILFRSALQKWYTHNRRDLPWRRDHDPYRVWVSEIMLQQTRVAAVVEHYRRFLKRFPKVEILAAARESSVVAAWSGLGYYRRARALHAASKIVAKQCGGKLPTSSAKLADLPGIGRYTSAAIASIAYGERIAAVDGNVQRVVERLMGRVFGAEAIMQTAQQLLSRESPGDFNQAMMELGATVCTPRQPKCAVCPVSEYCATRGAISKMVTRNAQKKRTICYGLNCDSGSVFLVKRSQEASLMPGMWELPEITRKRRAIPSVFTLRHSITATDFTVHVVMGSIPAESSGEWIKTKRVRTLPLTGLAKKILRTANVI